MTDKPIRKYMPSNGTEGMGFIEQWCDRCTREEWSDENPDGKKCPILTQSFVAPRSESPEEWRYNPETGRPECAAFEAKP